ncbi:hypothetical protein DFH07DRAFT_943968 [Mycena maculata]|uniref:Uncharacterized protein n=1 Tax=Mycena maculata TaxID=230809 RepID=A0AAD7IDE3_9AGAR|nr:hypothetical protein DFH07DRAFT_943968 [Mycena maculata]
MAARIRSHQITSLVRLNLDRAFFLMWSHDAAAGLGHLALLLCLVSPRRSLFQTSLQNLGLPSEDNNSFTTSLQRAQRPKQYTY